VRWSARRKIGVYLAITFTASWAIGIGFAAFGGDARSPAFVPMALLFMMPPAFAALIVKGAVLNEPVVEELGIKLRLNRWFLAAWLIPPLVYVLSVALSGLLPGVTWMTSVDDIAAHVRGSVPAEQWPDVEREMRSGPHPVLAMLMNAMLMGISLNAVRGLGEELGWRGFLHHELRLGFFRKATVTGLIWGVWYAPLVAQGFAHPDAPIAGIPMYVAWCVLLSAILTYVRERSGSVLACGVLYGTMQSVSTLPSLTSAGSSLFVGVHGVAGIAALALVFGLLVLHDRRVADAPIIR
jgi:hypothetical protein